MSFTLITTGAFSAAASRARSSELAIATATRMAGRPRKVCSRVTRWLCAIGGWWAPASVLPAVLPLPRPRN